MLSVGKGRKERAASKGPILSVVMPYYENHTTLRACLRSFQWQHEMPRSSYEIIVVDDASEHPAEPIIRELGWDIRVLRNDTNQGQAITTNRGIDAAKGQYVLLTCSDIIAERTLLWQHLQAHKDANKETIAVLGHIPYAPYLHPTMFLKYMSKDGFQFAFGLIQDPDNTPAEFCYAPNFSLPRRMLNHLGGFDERFPYGWQDTELGLRLHMNNVRIVYKKEAIGYHDDPPSLLAFSKRQIRVGNSFWDMLDKHPGYNGQVYFWLMAEVLAPAIGDLDNVLRQVVMFEEKVSKYPGFEEKIQTKIESLYERVLQISFVKGMAQKPDRLKAFIEAGHKNESFCDEMKKRRNALRLKNLHSNRDNTASTKVREQAVQRTGT